MKDAAAPPGIPGSPGIPGTPTIDGVKADPPVRPDGLCVVCLKPRKPERSAKYAQGQADVDPFCGSACCMEWHGVTYTTARQAA